MKFGKSHCAYFGNDWIGMFVKSNPDLTLIPMDCMDKLEDKIRARLGTSVARASVAGTTLLGLYVAMNSHGIILPQLTLDKEVEFYKTLGLNVYVSKEKMNAHGNNLAVNDKGGLINPVISNAERKNMEDVLGIELVPMSLSGYNTVGSCVLATEGGFLAHFKTNGDELRGIKEALHTGGSRGTVNFGVGFVGMGAVVNSNGYLVGGKTTVHEMGRLEEAFDMME